MKQLKFGNNKNRKLSTLKRRQAKAAYGFLVPGLSFFIPFRFLSILAVILMSFISWKGYSFKTIQWVGLENYKQVLVDPIFLKSLWHNIQFVVIVVLLQTAIALLLAIFLELQLPLSKFIRGIYFMPTVLSLVVVGILFGFIFSPSGGLMNTFIAQIGFKEQPLWLADPKIALFVIMGITIWKDFGLSMFIFIAGLEAIPNDLFDAAKVDGANSWKIFIHIIFPLLKETTTVVMILTTINCFKLFDLVNVMTKGGPYYATEVLATRMYKQAFHYNFFGYGATVGVILLIITFSASILQLKIRESGDAIQY